MVPLFLFLHVMGALVAFGPSFTFPLIGAASAREPQHAHFGAVISEIIEKRLVIPFALLQGVTGVVLIVAAGIDLKASPWLAGGILLYVVAILFTILVQAPRVARMVELTAVPPPTQVAGSTPAGPPPELLATARGLQQGGMLMSVLLVLIVILMVVKPTF
jgi:uncharacterized membrane protein